MVNNVEISRVSPRKKNTIWVREEGRSSWGKAKVGVYYSLIEDCSLATVKIKRRRIRRYTPNELITIGEEAKRIISQGGLKR